LAFLPHLSLFLFVGMAKKLYFCLSKNKVLGLFSQNKNGSKMHNSNKKVLLR